jgi:threonine/homoserine/homoserine lactone efflux protein
LVILILHFLRGLGLGVAAGVPFGPVNGAVVDTAIRRDFRMAMAVGLGGAFVDFIYSQLAVLGIGRVLKSHPDVSLVLSFVSGVVLVMFGMRTLLAPPLREDQGTQSTRISPRATWAAFFSGVLLTLANPAALMVWVVLAGSILRDVSHLEGFVAGLGIFVGCSAWFAGIAWLAKVGQLRFGRRVLVLSKTISAFIVVYGVFLVGKAGFSAWTLHMR